ncbi:MAG: 3-hydroxyacyl-ACP dehydratase FabZ [Opitutaceae bacterium]|jgi:3-hydroxyacyl-[acyl-carrier-protein] dehydratase
MEGFSLNSIQLQEYQPNRYPFLMIDYVDWVVPGKSAKGYKNLTLNEWYFPMHFPGAPNMPGALQLEALAQMLTVAITTQPGLKGKVTHALQHTVRFRKEVRPGDKLVIETEVVSWKRGIAQGKGVGYTNGEIACSADMLITIPDILEQFLPKKTVSVEKAQGAT